MNCPYCDLPRSRQECIDENMARGVLPACACGPRDDASKAVKRRFRKWLAGANCGNEATNRVGGRGYDL